MKAKFYPILTRAIEEGLGHAYRVVEEHVDARLGESLDKEMWVEIAEREILNALDEVFQFDDEEA